MSFEYVREIPNPGEIIAAMPVSPELREIKKKQDQEIKAVFTGESEKFVLIIGPCSAHDEDAVCDYISRLAKVQSEVKDKIILIPRIYTNKPRTTGIGYKGMAHQPNLNQEPNIVEGIKAILDKGSYDMGPKVGRIEDPAQWTGEKIARRAASLGGDKGPEGDFDD